MKRAFPHGEDPGNVAGGDTSALLPAGRKPTSFQNQKGPPGSDGIENGKKAKPTDAEMFDKAATVDQPEGAEDEEGAGGINFLQLVSEAEEQALLYLSQTNRQEWTQAYHAFHNEHYSGSKYHKPDYRNRSRLFVPKTRSAIRKDMAATSASLFNNLDAINCIAGDESDPNQRAGASILEELVNYRTDRSSGRAALPWFNVAMGARQDALLTGICLSKQSWKLELKQTQSEEETTDEKTGETKKETVVRFEPDVDRPDSQLLPPENFTIDPAADWTNPEQSAAYVILKWPMQMDEVRRMQKHPVNPWKEVDQSVLTAASEAGKFDQAAIRRAREAGLDRMDETQTGNTFRIVWVYEVFMRVDGEDWTFYSVGDQAFLTDPRPVSEVYPEQFGERPLALGYGSLEAHRIFPMAPAVSWQPYQLEINDIRNLALDALKQNVMPVTKVKRGAQVDLDQVKRRASGSSIMVNNKDDVTWEQAPTFPQSVPEMSRALEIEMDDLAGQFNGATTQNNNAVSRTLGGLKLVAGSANAVQEMDIRVWIHSWAEKVLAQIVRLEQYYESDPVVLGICGQRAQLFQKYGVNEITNALLEQEVTTRVSVGLGAGDPQQRLQRFQAASQIAAPLLASSPQFQSGEYSMDADAIMEEVFGAAGYRDGGMRFIKKGAPKQNPMAALEQQEKQSIIEKNKAQGKSVLLNSLAALAKVGLGDREHEAGLTNDMLGFHLQAMDMGNKHAHDLHDRLLGAMDHGHRHGLAIADHRQGIKNADREAQMRMSEAAAASEGGDGASADGGGGGAGGAAAPAQDAQPQENPQAEEIMGKMQQIIELMSRKKTLVRDENHRIIGIR